MMIQLPWWGAQVSLVAAGLAVSVCAPAFAGEGARHVAAAGVAGVSSGTHSASVSTGETPTTGNRTRYRCVRGTNAVRAHGRNGVSANGANGRNANGGRGGAAGQRGRDGQRGADGQSVIVIRRPGPSNVSAAECAAEVRRAQQRMAQARARARQQAAAAQARLRKAMGNIGRRHR